MQTQTFKTYEEALKDANSIVNQDIKSKFVRREVLANVNSMVEYILSKGFEDREAPFSIDDVENYYSFPEYYGVYAKFEGGTEEERDEEVENLTEMLQEVTSLYDELDEKDERTDDEDLEYYKLEEKKDILSDEIRYLNELESEPQEVFEWWIVSGYLCEKLEDYGYPVISSENIYGRTCTGQAILLDEVISRICADMEILEGQRFSWVNKK